MDVTTERVPVPVIQPEDATDESADAFSNLFG
jgi:hypothetical protein